MIKVSVMYPYAEGARFDHKYYQGVHMPLIQRRMGDACLRYTVDRGLAGASADAPPQYVAMCHIYCESLETFQASFGPHAKEILADVRNYTEIKPVMQVSDVVVG